MPLSAVVMMLVILGIVWGGFATILTVALRKERLKRIEIHEE